MPSWVSAQNNIHKIDDNLFDYYESCRKVSDKPEVLPMADTLFSRAVKIDDKRAQCLALYLKAEYYYYKSDTLQLREAVNHVGKISLQLNEPKFYFAARVRVITNKINKRHFIDALSEIESLQKEAFKLNNAYGIANAYTCFGHLYRMQRNSDLAIENYLKATEYHEKYGNPLESALIYKHLSDLYTYIKEYDKSLFYAHKSYALAVGNVRKTSALIALANLHVKIKSDSASYYMAMIDSIMKIEPPKSSTLAAYSRVAFIYYLREVKDAEKALSVTDFLHRSLQNEYKSIAYEELGNYEEALLFHEKHDSTKRKSKREEIYTSLSGFKSRLVLNMQEAENEKLIFQNRMLEIARIQDIQRLLEAEKKKDVLQLSTAALELQNLQLTKEQKELQVAFNQSEIAQNKERIRAAKARKWMNKLIFTFILLTFILLIIGIMIYLIGRKRYTKRLKYEHSMAIKAKEEANLARAEAELSNRQKSILLQNMSHEIRTPLNGIVGFSEVLNTTEDLGITTEERMELLELIRKNTTLLTTLINDVLDLSGLASNYYSLTFSEVRLNKLCSDVVKSLSSRIPAGVEAKLDLPTSQNDSFYTDPIRLQQVLVNFLTNACKYTEKGSITLGYSFLPTGDVAFYVADTGIGVSPEKADQLFKRFEMLGSSKQGTGLGLDISLRIAELLTGTIYLDNSYTQGAKFVFVHPQLKISSSKIAKKA